MLGVNATATMPGAPRENHSAFEHTADTRRRFEGLEPSAEVETEAETERTLTQPLPLRVVCAHPCGHPYGAPICSLGCKHALRRYNNKNTGACATPPPRCASPHSPIANAPCRRTDRLQSIPFPCPRAATIPLDSQPIPDTRAKPVFRHTDHVDHYLPQPRHACHLRSD